MAKNSRMEVEPFEDVHQMSYDVLLTYPKWDTPNHVYVVAQDGRVLFNSSGLSPDLIGVSVHNLKVQSD